MGPGLNAYVERKVFTPETPLVDYWDQPETDSFETLVESTCDKIQKMAQNRGEPIDLICHSFGGNLAEAALTEIHSLVRSCTFFATGFYFLESFKNLLWALAQSPGTDPHLREEYKDFLANLEELGSKNYFRRVFGEILKDPDFMRLYWGSPINAQKFQSFCPESSPIKSRDVFQCLPKFFKD